MWNCARSFRLRLLMGVAVLLLAFASSPSMAATITYDGTTDRPTLFEDISLDLGDGAGTLTYDVIVTWAPFYTIFSWDETSYPLDSRLIGWGDATKADAALGALTSALTADAFTGTTSTSYLNVPVSAFGASFVIATRLVNLIGGIGAIQDGNFSRSHPYGTPGYTQWTVVPEPSTGLLMGMGLLMGAVVSRKS